MVKTKDLHRNLSLHLRTVGQRVAVDLRQVDSLIFLVMARYMGTIKKKTEKGGNLAKDFAKVKVAGANKKSHCFF